MKRFLTVFLAIVLIICLFPASVFAEEEKTDGICNILVMGNDVRKSQTSDIGRSETMMIVSLNGETGDIKLVSLECEVIAPYPEDMCPDGPKSGRIVDAFYLGGGELAKRVVSDAFNIKIDNFAQVEYDAFEQIIDTLGGVDIELTEIEAKTLNSTKAMSHNLKAGVEHLTGPDALYYVRLEHTDDDWTRQRRQRHLMEAVFDSFRDLDLEKLGDLLHAVYNLVNTDLSFLNLVSIFARADKFLSGKITEIQVPDKNETVMENVECNFEYESEKISQFIYGTEMDINNQYSVAANEYINHTVEADEKG